MQPTADQRSRVAAICRRFHVQRLRMFGSAATGDERADSDIDLLVEFVPGQAPSAFELTDLSDELSRALGGGAVDLAFAPILDNPYRRRVIEPQLRPLFG